MHAAHAAQRDIKFRRFIMTGITGFYKWLICKTIRGNGSLNVQNLFKCEEGYMDIIS
jgi:hypothetical protein